MHFGRMFASVFPAARVAALGLGLLLPACASPSEPPSNDEMFSTSEAYERFMGRWSRALAPSFLEFSGLEQDDAVLDVGSGTGALAAALVSAAPGCTVVGIDPSAAFVAYARTRTTDERATFEVGDGQALRFEDDSFDRTLSLLVVNFIPDPAKAVREMVRVTRPGGVVAAAVWDYSEGMEMLRVFWDEVVALDPAAGPRDERHMPFCTARELEALWRENGILDVRVAPLVVPMQWPSFSAYWAPFEEGIGPAGAYVAGLAEPARSRLRERVRQRLDPGNRGGGIALTARAWAVRGTVADE